MLSSLFLLLTLLLLTTAQNLGDPTLLRSYPPCAPICGGTVLQTGVCAPANTLSCQCSAEFLAQSIACEKVSCSPQDYDKTQTLTQELCGPLYANGTVSNSTVSAAVASSTAAAAAAVAGKDPTKSGDYPPCADKCQRQFITSSNCGNIANASCICSNVGLVNQIASCEAATCSDEDQANARYLGYKLCTPVGGLGNASEVVNQTVATQTPGRGIGSEPTSTPFTGTAVGRWGGSLSWAIFAAVPVVVLSML
ncbi:hypothetical protein G7Y79_00064g094060 [Physcia stellaris]|nr:hypothetical protein G7Y79_00064g094060 [Physcia stellaris]